MDKYSPAMYDFLNTDEAKAIQNLRRDKSPNEGSIGSDSSGDSFLQKLSL